MANKLTVLKQYRDMPESSFEDIARLCRKDISALSIKSFLRKEELFFKSSYYNPKEIRYEFDFLSKLYPLMSKHVTAPYALFQVESDRHGKNPGFTLTGYIVDLVPAVLLKQPETVRS